MQLLPRELHLTDRPSATAQWTTLGRAIEFIRPEPERIVSDPFAALFLTRAYRAMLDGLRLSAPSLRWAERADVAGLATFALCRHAFIDSHLLEAIDRGVQQIVILGAGYDARAYRFADRIAGRPVYEVDLPPLSRRKAGIVAGSPDVFGMASIRRVEIDFRRESLAQRLEAAGFATGVPTFVAWEGVSMYLTHDAVQATLRTLGEICGAGSTIAMDYWYRVDGTGAADQIRRLGARAIRLIGEPVTFGLPPRDAPEFLAEHGFEVVDLAEADDLARRFATDGRRSEKSVYAVAARL